MAALPEQEFHLRGIVADLPPEQVDPDKWTSAQNIFFRDIATQRVAGYLSAFRQNGINVYYIWPLQRVQEALWIFCGVQGGNTKLWTWDGSALTERLVYSPSFDPPTANGRDWQCTVLNGVAVVNNGVNPPVYWNPNDSTKPAFEELPGWPASYRCRSIRAFKNNLFALGITTDTQILGDWYMWSSSAAPGTIPSEWTPAATNDAGNDSISQPQGAIVDAWPLRDKLCIAKNFSLHVVSFTGGSLVFDQRDLYISAGCLALDCIDEINGRLYIATQDDIIETDGHAMRSICTHEVRRFIFGNINPDQFNLCQLVKRHVTDEIWFCYPEVGADKLTKAAIYNTATNQWGVRDLPNVHYLAHGILNDPGPAETWATKTTQWQTDLTIWDESRYSATNDVIAMAEPGQSTGDVHILDADTTNNGTPLIAQVERVGLPFGDPHNVKTVTEIRPEVVGEPGDVIEVQVGGQTYFGEPVTWSSPVPFAIGTFPNKVDVFATGRWLAIRFRSVGGRPWRIHRFRVSYKEGGRY